MKRLQDFDNITQAKAYSLAEPKLIASDTMRILLLNTGLYTYFKQADTDLKAATWDTLQSGGEFNFMEGHRKNVTSLFDLIIAQEPSEEIQSKLKDLKAYCIQEANRVVYPFKSVTEEEYKIAELQKVPTTKEAIGPSDLGYIVVKKGDLVSLTITPIGSIDADDVLTVKCKSALDISKPLASDDIFRGQAVIPKGSVDPVILAKVNTSGLLPIVKIEVTSKYNRDFRVEANYGV